MITNLTCIQCGTYYHINRTTYVCDKCHGQLEAKHQDIEWTVNSSPGVWRYKEMLHPTIPEYFVSTLSEGNTSIYDDDRVSEYAGLNTLHIKHEGRNPTGSFKDRGMAVAISEAKRQRMQNAICVSSGETSSSAAAHSSHSELSCTVLAYGEVEDSRKLSQARAYGAEIQHINGSYIDAVDRINEKVRGRGKYYPLNSTNPWVIEGQKTTVFELIESILTLDFIAIPAGSLDTICAFGKAIREMKELGVLYDVPKIVAVRTRGGGPVTGINEEVGCGCSIERVNGNLDLEFHDFLNWKKAEREMVYTKGVPVTVSSRRT